MCLRHDNDERKFLKQKNHHFLYQRQRYHVELSKSIFPSYLRVIIYQNWQIVPIVIHLSQILI